MVIDLNSTIVATDILAILMLSIVDIAVVLEKNKVKRNSAFVGCVTMTIFSLLFEVFNYTLEGNPLHEGFLYITNYGTVIVGEGILYFFAKYAYECVNEKKNTKDIILNIIKGICAIDFVVQTFGVITGKSFVIKDAQFVATELYDISFICAGVGLAIIKIYLFRNSKYIGKYLYKVFTLYYVLPVIAVGVILINVEWSFLLQSIALSLLIIYIGIEKQEKENLLTDLIDKDTLTGLQNRNAWNDKIEEIINKTTEVGIVFADLNNLKYANDHFGHLAGDALINTFADILKSTFDERNIYRIGGDEFVVVVEKNVDNLKMKLKSLRKR